MATRAVLAAPVSALAEASTVDDVSSAEQAAHRAATAPEVRGVATSVNQVFGRDLLAIMTGVQNPRTVTQWIRGESTPHPGTARALRDVAYVATFLLASGTPKETVQAWFVGMNPHLKGKSPAVVIGQDPITVLNAAKAFVQYD